MGAIAYPNQNIDQFGYEIQRRQIHIDGLMQDYSNSSVYSMGLLQSCTEPLACA